MHSGEQVQQELLIRISDRDGVIRSPDDFLPVAERTGRIIDIDRWVVDRALELAAWGQPVELNISGVSLSLAGFERDIAQRIACSGVDTSLLVFEITETALISDLDTASSFARSVADLGCRLALDDFGTGFNGLLHLRHFPVHFLKIDQAFVRQLVEDRQNQRIVQAIVSMARNLDVLTVAEGIEDPATMEILRDLGVDLAQGFHVARPERVAAPWSTLSRDAGRPNTMPHARVPNPHS